MRLTCLAGGDGEGRGESLPCFVLDICHTRVLLECPIDLSCLLQFLPTSSASDSSRQHLPSLSRPLMKTKNAAIGKSDHQRPGKLPRLSIDRSIEAEGSGIWKKLGQAYFLDCAPQYKTPDYSHFDVTSLNAVVISNPVAMLGLPFLFRNPDFTAKVYMTDATARFGQLMMEELVSLHKEFLQIHGRSTSSSIPPWLLPGFATTLPKEAREQLIGSDCATGQWHQLYNTDDVRACMAKVHRLRFGEEATVDGYIRVTATSAGYGIGSSNWVVIGAHRSLSYLSTSISKANCAQSLDISSLEQSQVLLLSSNNVMESQDSGEIAKGSGLVALEDISTKVVSAQEMMANETRRTNEDGTVPKASSQRISPNPTSVAGVSSGVANSSTGNVPKLSSSQVLQAIPERSWKSASEEIEDAAPSTPLFNDKRIGLICNAAVESLRDGGSVLIPISFDGMFLELMEEISEMLKRVGLEKIPIYFVSPVAEELLAYSNTVPEWLCPARQEKLYAGEALFRFIESVKEKRLLHLPALQSSDLMKCWQEPCVVFASHWSLRVGSAVRLLNHWRTSPSCLLVLTEPNIDKNVLLAPFMPIAMQVLHLPASPYLRSKDLVAIVQKVKPQLTLIAESSKNSLDHQSSVETKAGPLMFYGIWKTLKIPRFASQNDLQVELSADLALQIQLKELRAGKLAAARLRAELRQKDGNWFLDVAPPSALSKGGLPSNQIRWGNIKLESLLTALRERGMYDLSIGEKSGSEGENGETLERKTIVVELKSPSPAHITFSSGKIHIHANEPSLRLKLVEAVNSVLNVL